MKGVLQPGADPGVDIGGGGIWLAQSTTLSITGVCVGVQVPCAVAPLDNCASYEPQLRSHVYHLNSSVTGVPLRS